MTTEMPPPSPSPFSPSLSPTPPCECRPTVFDFSTSIHSPPLYRRPTSPILPSSVLWRSAHQQIHSHPVSVIEIVPTSPEGKPTRQSRERHLSRRRRAASAQPTTALLHLRQQHHAPFFSSSSIRRKEEQQQSGWEEEGGDDYPLGDEYGARGGGKAGNKGYLGHFSHSHSSQLASGAAGDADAEVGYEGICNHWLVQCLINMRCTELSIWLASFYTGLVVLAMQVVPFFLMHWLLVTEPRGVNATDDKGEAVEAPFYYQAGYFEMCRWLDPDRLESEGIADPQQRWELANAPENVPACVWNSAYTGEDLFEFSFATNAILVRMPVPTALHVVAALLSLVALALSTLGHLREDAKTIYASICYVCAGLMISVTVLQLICIVDDEMYPRMKPNAAGELSKYHFRYGVAFFSTAMSFLPIQLCIYLQTTIYFRRHRSPAEKASAVPGLSVLLAQLPSLLSRSSPQLRFGAHHQPLLATAATKASLLPRASPVSLMGAGERSSFAMRRRESRTSSRDLGTPFAVHEEVATLGQLMAPALTGSLTPRRPSLQLSVSGV